MDIDPGLVTLATTLLAAGGAFGGVKVALNGTREMAKRTDENVVLLDAKLTAHMKDEDAHLQRLTRVETILEERLPKK